ncbi:LON peptidase substrate-binding domain-containing protein [Rhodococcus spongiicola]|uniref:ATP-dependent protease n=1 Tax=Rhodococcus spongiicola TaxID=2487352 RepID=A0A438AV54_9NOCA|nr:LON peptidase substrate-binding domain-containing protein [Rhodococcus spongiicola]RVW02608.1 ATP-dependent protease [Rhodococcus spongiicola]
MTVMPMFPLGSTLLPGERLPLHVFEPRYQALVRDCLTATEGPLFGTVLIARGHEVGGGDVRHDIGTTVRIVSHVDIGDGRYALDCVGEERIRVRHWLGDDPYPRAEVEVWPVGPTGRVSDRQLQQLIGKITELYVVLNRVREQREDPPPAPPSLLDVLERPGDHLYAIASWVPMGAADRYAVLAAAMADERYQAFADAVDNAREIAEFRLSER